MSYKLNHIKRNLLILAIVCFCVSCTKESTPQKDTTPANYQEMFDALNLQFNVTYKYIERINNIETGNNGTVKFLLTDTSMVETYNSKITKDHFRLDSLKTYSAFFESFGQNKYNVNDCLFINKAQQNISLVNGSSMVSFRITSNGSYYFYQYLLLK